MKNRLKTAALLTVLAMLVAAAGLVATAAKQPRAEASPNAILGLNSASCVALSIAFGGLDQNAAAADCLNIQVQAGATGSVQELVKCLRGADFDQNGTHDCLTTSDLLQITPDDFTAMDLDKNQVHAGQYLFVFAFVNDDFPVRFTTDKGRFIDYNGGDHGKDLYCQTADPLTAGDPDCDGDQSTPGDGVVVARIRIDAGDDVGPAHVTAIQEGIGFPMDFSIVGKSKTIKITPLFGKDTIQTGATIPPAAGSKDPVLPTDCSFDASLEGVLAAIGTAEKSVLIAKVLDTDDNEVVGALLNWDKPFNESNIQEQGGVALGQTPTLDLGGSIGIGFPQFICGGKQTGDLTEKVTLANNLDPFADQVSYAKVTVHVIGAPSSIALAADPPEIECNGTNTSKITATVTNADGQPVANGEDVHFDVQVLGTTAPLKADTAAGVASSVVTPLRGAASTGVPVIVTAGDVQASILIRCLPVSEQPAPPPAGGQPGGGAAGAGAGAPTGTISGPDTGSGGIDADGRGAMSWWPMLGLAAAAMAMATARFTLKRR